MDEWNKGKLGGCLKTLRQTRGLTYDEMGNLLLVSGRTVRRWESAEVTPTIDDIFQYL